MTQMKCRCGYEWTTGSTKMYVTCPNCLRKVENPDYNKKIKEDKNEGNTMAT